ncbi:MAG: GNAT family N-acetyltransferase [Patescibacteria group bacterium]|nr:GNAT family N-acetyltransferase [Patescibacteria group bacterium]
MLSARKANIEDAKFLFLLRNEDGVRKFFWDQKPVKWQDHLSWLEAVLHGNQKKIYIIEKDKTPIGQVRFDIEDENAEISISISSKFHGQGYGTEALKESQEKFIKECENIKEIHAHIKQENNASTKVFKKIGYTETNETQFKGNPCISMLYNVKK